MVTLCFGRILTRLGLPIPSFPVDSLSRIIKANLKSAGLKILPCNCELICDLLQLKLTKLKLEVLKSDFQSKKRKI